jgi:hypothetical protein
MDNKVSSDTKAELVKVLRIQYLKSTKIERTRILDQFIAVSGYHRKHAIRILKCDSGNDSHNRNSNIISCSRRIYGEAVKESLIVLWEAADRICGKRLKAILPSLVDAMERHGHLNLSSDVKKKLLNISSATIDRLLCSVRNSSQSKKTRRRSKKVGQQVPVRTFADWGSPDPGYLEIDFVFHAGGVMIGSFIHTLVGTDVSTGWTEFIPLLVREQSLVVEGLDVMFRQAPFRILGIDSDNDSAFINDTLLGFCRKNQIQFTRSRAYQKNDQAWVEQKNGAIIRRLVGHERFSGIVACQALAHLYQAARLYVNYFQPSFKLLDKSRNGFKIKRIYEPPATPCDRLLKHPAIDDQIKEELRLQRQKIDPLKLLHHIRKSQSALAALTSTDHGIQGPGRESLEQFLSQLPQLWKDGEVRPTHRSKASEPRYWRTHVDAFEGIWYEVLEWLQTEPDETAKSLLNRLQNKYPGRFVDGQLRTLQRRVKEWRKIMARELIYGSKDA